MKVSFINTNSGINRQVKVGFSWTCFFFGGIPFFFRGMFWYGLAFLFLNVITMGLSSVILAFLANKLTATYYLDHGYRPDTQRPGWDYAAAKWGMQLNEISHRSAPLASA